jgi:hypothetical protein
MTTTAINRTNHGLQENNTVLAERESAGIVIFPQGEIEQDGYPAGAAFTGRTGIAPQSRISLMGGVSSYSLPDGEDDIFEEGNRFRIPGRLITKIQRISNRLGTLGVRGYF